MVYLVVLRSCESVLFPDSTSSTVETKSRRRTENTETWFQWTRRGPSGPECSLTEPIPTNEKKTEGHWDVSERNSLVRHRLEDLSVRGYSGMVEDLRRDPKGGNEKTFLMGEEANNTCPRRYLSYFDRLKVQ